MLKKIHTLSSQEKKTLLERMVKLQEECGELAQEVLISLKASGSKDKLSKEGVKGEAVDVVLVALSIFFQEGGTVQEFEELVVKKGIKWEKQIKS